jgi:hypothetical protein
MITDWGFVFTVGTALLHIVLEAWRLVPFVKQGRFKERMKALFLHLVITADMSSTHQGGEGSRTAAPAGMVEKVPSGVTSGVTSDVTSDGAGSSSGIASGRALRTGKGDNAESDMRIAVASADHISNTQQQLNQAVMRL